MAATTGETRKSDTWAELVPSESIALVSTPRPEDDASLVVRSPSLFQYSYTSIGSEQQKPALNSPMMSQSSRPSSPLSIPPKPLTPPANAGNGGGGGAGGRSTPNAGMGGGGPTGGGGGPGLVNANQFVGVNFGASQGGATANAGGAFVGPASPPDHAGQGPAGKPDLQNAASPFAYSMTPPTLVETHYQSLSPSVSHGHGHGHDPLYVLDMNTGETVPANAKLNTFSTWSENLLAQVSGGTVSSYSWNVSQAPRSHQCQRHEYGQSARHLGQLHGVSTHRYHQRHRNAAKRTTPDEKRKGEKEKGTA